MIHGRQPCETIVIDVLPTIRAELAILLLEEYGLSQTKAADLLGVTQAAISQYSTKRRGGTRTLKDYPEIRQRIREMADSIVNGIGDDERGLQLCKLCRICQEMVFGIEDPLRV
ncbi:MAG: XRE family transcriptional regulator [Candidatus Thermoplasmatota archaeon]|nr:XRE family transcriptional regulator [Candidatus Thermoplasmatota archaeon]